MLGILIRFWKAWRFRRQRELYTFYDGRRWRRIDPWRTWRTFLADPEYNNDTMAPLVEAEQEPELTYALNAICRSFGVQRFDATTGRGLTDDELLAVFKGFADYLADIKKKQNPGPTLSAPTDGLSSPSPAVQSSTTNSDSPWPCSMHEPECEPAESFPTAY